MRDKQEIESEIAAIELGMQQPDFWANKDTAQDAVRTLQALKDELEGVGKFDKGSAILTIFAGAGGDDAEDFARILLEMYKKYVAGRGWQVTYVHEHKNDVGGYRNVTIRIDGKNAYGSLKHESGVHRLVRISPFNAKQQRHTAFAMAEVLPVFEKHDAFEIPDGDLTVELSKSGGPGGQNVNKRETAVRIVHNPTGIAVQCDKERSQLANKERALEILYGKLHKLLEEQHKERVEDLQVSKTTSVEWGNQIRSYVFHPYQMVKDHRTNTEIRDVDSVLDGGIEPFIEACKKEGGVC
ncbi:MAG: PCRF domain-containing protein [bacterium]|nr:PCRF domain-containing protein [bacterium]